ncbi:hypothetical protein R6L23_09930 [Streptomyces sp. SR27]|uniref:hypothetical protein n=1 Tax=Streptomyces sp. SR27 TaxID=3076630 RepID=UPI00295AEA14|nr:hypothetical protein [Streptomyces sp. SR27]MDV9188531.1 hypothetical protein [Streptomyces sp. SR27]
MTSANMAESTREAWLNRITATGLTVSDDPAPSDALSPREAWQSVIHGEVQPAATVPLSHPQALTEVDRQWHVHAAQNELFGNDGSFLLSISGSGSWGFGWAVVKWSPRTELAPKLSKGEEGLDFVAMSLNGKSVCAVTEEEYDYWIVVQQLR